MGGQLSGGDAKGGVGACADPFRQGEGGDLTGGLPLQGGRRRAALVAALLAGAAFAVQLRCAVGPYQMFYAYENKLLRYCTKFPTWRTYLDFPAAVLYPLAIGGMAMVFVFARRRDAELKSSLRDARAAELHGAVRMCLIN